MKVIQVSLLLTAIIVVSGCKSVDHYTVSVPESNMNSSVSQVAGEVTFMSLKAASSTPEKAEKNKKIVQSAQGILRSSVIPLLQGEDLNLITANTVNEVLRQFSNEVSGFIRTAVQLALNTGISVLDLPENPTDALSEAQRTLLLSLVAGIDSGMDRFLQWSPPAAAAEGERGLPRDVDVCELKLKAIE